MDDVLRDPTAARNADVLRRLVLAHRYCTPPGLAGAAPFSMPVAECVAVEALDRAISALASAPRPRDLAGTYLTVGEEFLRNQHPMVRSAAGTLLLAAANSDPAAVAVLVAAAKAERDPEVLARLLAIGSRAATDRAVRALLLAEATHARSEIRSTAGQWLLRAAESGAPGAFEKVLVMLDDDPDPGVRAMLCRSLRLSADPRALSAIRRQLTDGDTPDPVWAGCWYALLWAWSPGIWAKAPPPSRGAYELTLQLLEQRPRAVRQLAGTGLMELRRVTDMPEQDDPRSEHWVAVVNGWYDHGRLLRALKGLVADVLASDLTRVESLRLLFQLGAPKEAFEALWSRCTREVELEDGSPLSLEFERIFRQFSKGTAPGQF